MVTLAKYLCGALVALAVLTLYLIDPALAQEAAECASGLAPKPEHKPESESEPEPNKRPARCGALSLGALVAEYQLEQQRRRQLATDGRSATPSFAGWTPPTRRSSR